jgi:hypothetical protein
MAHAVTPNIPLVSDFDVKDLQYLNRLKIELVFSVTVCQ